MNNKERYDFYKSNGLTNQTEEDRIEKLVDILIDSLYIPVLGYEGVTHTDQTRIKHFGIDNEPINWGDLKCCEVKKFEDGSFLVTVDEASPGDCPTFCAYIETYMKSYGWDIKVQTEW